MLVQNATKAPGAASSDDLFVSGRIAGGVCLQLGQQATVSDRGSVGTSQATSLLCALGNYPPVVVAAVT